MNNFCDIHKGKSDNIIQIIEFKKGKISEVNICSECLKKHLDFDMDISLEKNEIKYIQSLVDECPKCGLSRKDIGEELLCPYCYIYFNINLKEQKIISIQNKMAAAVEIEDYETAAILKKELDVLRALDPILHFSWIYNSKSFKKFI